MSRDNLDRANKVEKLLGLKGNDTKKEYYGVADVICDLMHFCDFKKLNFSDELSKAEGFYQTEKQD
jgi:hypothetical protein